MNLSVHFVGEARSETDYAKSHSICTAFRDRHNPHGNPCDRRAQHGLRYCPADYHRGNRRFRDCDPGKLAGCAQNNALSEDLNQTAPAMQWLRIGSAGAKLATRDPFGNA